MLNPRSSLRLLTHLAVVALIGVAVVSAAQIAEIRHAQPVITLEPSAKAPSAMTSEASVSGARLSSTLTPEAIAAGLVSTDAAEKSAAFHASYREFIKTKAGQRSEPETFLYHFHAATRLTEIKVKGDFEVAGGSCSEGRNYMAGDSCSVEVLFKPQGPGHRTGSLAISHSASVTPFLTPIGGTGYSSVVSFIPAQISTVAGTLNGSTGLLGNVHNLTVDGGDSLWVPDPNSGLIKEKDSNGTLTTIVGGGTTPLLTTSSFGPGAKLSAPYSIATDFEGTVYFGDITDKIVGSYYIDNIAVLTIGSGTIDANTCFVTAKCGGGYLLIGAPVSLATDSSGELYMSLIYGNGQPGTTLAEYTAFDNSNQFFDLDTSDYNYYSASWAVSVDPLGYGNLYYTYEDPGSGILSPTPLCNILGQNYAYSNGVSPYRFWRVAGDGNCGFSGDNGKATGAEISKAVGQFAWDAAGDFYFTDSGNNRVRRVDGATGIIHTVAGNGGNGYNGDGEPATAASILTPQGLGVDSFGRVYTTGLIGTTGKSDIRVIGTTGALNFSSQTVGTRSSALSVLVTNSGNAYLNIASIGLTSGATSDFIIDPSNSNCSITQPLTPGNTCKIGVIFAPTAAGTRTAVITLVDDTVLGDNIIQLNGTAAAAAPAHASLSPTSEAFGNQVINTSSSARVLTLSNTGGATLTISSYGFTGTNAADFVQTHSCGSTLNAGANCTISVAFKPAATGSRTGSLSVVTTGGTVTAALTGTGTAAPAKAVLSATTQTYSSQNVGTASAAKSFTLSNTGGSAMTISTYTLSGTNPGDFIQSHNCTSSVSAGKTCTINVQFKPTAAGTRSATLTIATTGGSVSAKLTGSGFAPAAKPKVSLKSTINPVPADKSLTLFSSVSRSSSDLSQGSLNGYVELVEGTHVLGQAPLVGGTASFNMSDLPVGVHILNAVYTGDSAHPASTSPAVRQSVTPVIRRLSDLY